jgi:hypothetical protein
MFTKEGAIRSFGKLCGDDNGSESQPSSIRKFVLLEDGRMVPVEPGGMVEIALGELGAKIVEVQIHPEERVNQ